ncbi:monooxygenase family protein [Pigmentibacter ruber]
MVIKERMTANFKGDFVVFLIGMRLNIGNDDCVGIWHETYLASSCSYENIYANMPPFGLGKVGQISIVSKEKDSASQKLEI